MANDIAVLKIWIYHLSLNTSYKLSNNSTHITLAAGKYAYFASDMHLGAPNHHSSILRERKVCSWLEDIETSCGVLFLVGDIFDFWHEYRYAIPKGYTRLLGKLAHYSDNGIPIHIFTGNHDIWMYDYLQEELGIIIHRQAHQFIINDKKFFVAHGDGLGPGDYKFKVLKKMFTYPFFQWCFRWLHPDIGIKIATLWSQHSRTDPTTERFMGEDNEFLIQYAKRKYSTTPCDYFVFGHRHLPMEYPIAERCIYYNLGDWIVNFTFLIFDHEKCTLQKYI